MVISRACIGFPRKFERSDGGIDFPDTNSRPLDLRKQVEKGATSLRWTLQMNPAVPEIDKNGMISTESICSHAETMYPRHDPGNG